MAPTTAETLKQQQQLRWGQEEIDILVQMTTEQLELEAQDKSMMITWNQHWKKVSSRLKEKGYSRSFTACRGYWKRGVEAQRVRKEAAGMDWDDSEHKILIHMTKKQLSREEADPSARISWAKHWGNVSLQLQEEGYERTPDNCSAYWDLVETDWDLVETGVEVTSEIEGEDENEEDRLEEVVPLDLAVTSPQTSKASMWSPEEYENLFGLLKARRELEEKEGLDQLEGKKLWTEISRLHNNSGYDRTFEGCRTFWMKQGRERSGLDEREKPSSDRKISADSKESPLWSSVNVNGPGVEESIEARNPAIEALKIFQKEYSTPKPDTLSLESSPVADSVSFEPSHAIPKSMNPYVATTDSDQEHMEGSPVQPEKKQRKKGVTNFRLNDEQRATLEAEVAKGVIITSERKAELAQELNLELKTVKNWFTNYNVKARRSQGSTPVILTAKSAVKGDLDDNFHDSPVTATPTPAYNVVNHSLKRPFNDDDAHHSYPFQKPRLEVEPELPRPTSGFNVNSTITTPDPANINQPVNGVSNHRPLPQTHSHHLPRPPVLPSNATSRLVEDKHSSLAPQPAHAAHHPIQTIVPAQPSYSDRMVYSDRNNSLEINKEPSGRPSEMTGERIPTENGAAQPWEIRFKMVRSSDQSKVMDSESRNRWPPTQPESQGHGMMGHQIGSEANLPTMDPNWPQAVRAPQSINDDVTSPPKQATTLAPPATQYDNSSDERAKQQLATRTNEMNKLHNLDARSTLIHPASSRSSSEVHAPKSSISPASTNNTFPASSLPPANEDPKETAHRQVQSFTSDIENLKQANAIRTSRIDNLSQQLVNFATKRNEVDRNKQLEITHVLQEIDLKYEEQCTALRQQEDWLENSRNSEVEGLKKHTIELSKKEKGLARWQSLVEYYENEG